MSTLISDTAQPVSAQVFSMGHSPTYLASRRERLRSKKEAEAEKLRKKNMRNRRKPIYLKNPYQFKLHQKRWLLSDRDVPMDASIFFYMAGQTFQSIYEKIMDSIFKQNAHFKQYNKYLDGKPLIATLLFYQRIARKNQRLHRAFGCLARRWIRSKLTLKNTNAHFLGVFL